MNFLTVALVVLLLFSPQREAVGQLRWSDAAGDSVRQPSAAPQFLPEQDSAYYRALRFRIPADARFQLDLLATRDYWIQLQQQSQHSLAAVIERNITLSPEVWQPTPQEMVLYAYGLEQARYIPTVTSPRTMLGLTGVRIPIASIARFLGFGSDRSPRISFQLQDYATVTVLVYSIQAKKIATVYNGVRPAGNYTIAWDGRKDGGYPAEDGEYILEVRVQGRKDRFVLRKIVEWKKP